MDSDSGIDRDVNQRMGEPPAMKRCSSVDEPEQLTTSPRYPVLNAGSTTGRDHRRRFQRRDATIVAAWIGAVAVVVSAVIALIPHLLSSNESHRPEPSEVTMPPLPTPTCEGCKSGKTYQEQAGMDGARTYRDSRALLGEGARVPPLQKVDVQCKHDTEVDLRVLDC